MTSNYHTPIPSSPKQPANASTFNAPLGQMDAAISELALVERDGHIIQEEGSDLAQQPRLNFTGLGVGVTNTAGVTVVTIAGREVLTANRTYYVRSDGNDSNTGLVNSAGGAFLTIQKAVDIVYNTLDKNGFNVTIQVVDATYTGAVTIGVPSPGAGTISIVGNTSTPANCIISTTSATCFTVFGGAHVAIRGLKLQTTTSGDCIKVYDNGRCEIDTMNFGACSGIHLNCEQFGFIAITGNYTISGGAVAHYHTGSPSMLLVSPITVTIIGTPAFSGYFSGCAGGFQYLPGITFSGAATGTRYVVHKNGTIDVGTTSLTYLPGNAAGLEYSGGRYVGNDTDTDALVVTTNTFTAPTLLNSWVNFGSSYVDAGYLKDQFGFVRLRGVVKSGTVTAIIFQLPAGYRPSKDIFKAVSSNGAFGLVTIDSAGNVIASSGSNSWFSLDEISFAV